MISFSFGGTPGGFGNFGFDMETMDLDVELTIGSDIVESRHFKAPYQMIVAQCQQLVNQIAQDQRPMKVVFRGTKNVELPNGDIAQKPSRLIYANNKYTENFSLDYE